jgi:dTDP-4-dehydrorhamnose 3,5-epimerase-like enzyme
MEVATFAFKGAQRGNHYHRDYFERAFVHSGALTVTLRAVGPEAKEINSMQMAAGDVIDIPPMTYHVFEALEPSVVICFGSGPSSPRDDRHRLNG